MTTKSTPKTPARKPRKTVAKRTRSRKTVAKPAKTFFNPPPNLGPDAVLFFHELCVSVFELHGLEPSDAAIIELAARHFQTQRDAATASAAALAEGDIAEWRRSETVSMKASSSLRGALSTLRITPDDRGTKQAAQSKAARVIEHAGDDWKGLLS